MVKRGLTYSLLGEGQGHSLGTGTVLHGEYMDQKLLNKDPITRRVHSRSEETARRSKIPQDY